MLLEGILLVFTIPNMIAMICGIIIGLVFGAIPGLTFITGILIVLPMTYSMTAVTGILLMLGVYCGGMCGGSVSAILLGIPGTPSASATVLDGYPMAKNGQADKALGMALYASVIGGLISLVLLISGAQILAQFTEKFGAPERCALIFLGLSTICRVAGRDFIKGIISGIIGLMITTIGLDPIMGTQRFCFNSTTLMAGFTLLPVLIGMFAITEIMEATAKKTGGHSVTVEGKIRMPSWAEIKANMGNIVRSSIIGTVVGAIPGTGGSVACYLAYDAAKNASQDPDSFGKGNLAGVAAAESSNNAVSGGVLIPLLTLGIPGDSGAAIIMGALLVHGLRPGPALFRDQGDLVYAIFVGLMVINILMLIIHYFGIRGFIKVLKIPPAQMNGALLALCFIGAYAQSNRLFDALVIVPLMGLICYLLKRCGVPFTPMLLGVALGNSFETQFRSALVLSQGNPSIFFTRPISCVVVVITLVMIFWPLIKKVKRLLFGDKKTIKA